MKFLASLGLREIGSKNRCVPYAISSVLKERYAEEWFFDSDLLGDLYTKTYELAIKHPSIQYSLIKAFMHNPTCDTSLVHIVQQLYLANDEYQIFYQDLVDIADDIKMSSN